LLTGSVNNRSNIRPSPIVVLEGVVSSRWQYVAVRLGKLSKALKAWRTHLASIPFPDAIEKAISTIGCMFSYSCLSKNYEGAAASDFAKARAA
jgi:hypothetical protein